MNPLLYLIRYKKLGLFFIFFYSITFYSFAQDGLFSQYIFNPQLINPALINIENQRSNLYTIQSGDKFNNKYKTYWLSGSYELNSNKRSYKYNSNEYYSSVSVNLFDETNKNYGLSGLNLIYRKEYIFTAKNKRLSWSTALGLKKQNVHHYLDNQTGFVFGIKKLNIGFSGVNLFSKQVESSYFTYLSYKYQFSRSSLFTPIILFQFGEKNQFDGNFKYTYQSSFIDYSAILTYKSNNAFMITIGANSNNVLSVGYGIEFNKSNLISNQVFLKYQFNRFSVTVPDFW